MTQSLAFPPILYLPCFDYQVHRQRPQQLLYQLSLLGFNVIYCNVTQDKKNPFVILNDHFAVCQDPDAINKNHEYVMWLTHGPFVEQLPKYKINMVVSDIADISAEEFAPLEVWEKRKIDAADIVLCASQIIYDATVQKHSNVMLIRNAADYEHFAQVLDKDQSLLHDEIEARKLCLNTAPVVGFWGAVASWVNYELIAYLAKERPNYSFVFVGEIFCHGPEQIGKLPNVHWLGNRDYESLPAFARQFDAAIIPFQIRKVTEAANPVKLYEYLAAGLPVISTDLPEVRPFDEVRIGRSPSHFLQQLDEAIRFDRSPEKRQIRQNQAKRESWRARAQLVADQMLSKYMEKQK
ncbi:glycosyltransferase [Paenibacillus sp. CGMCC 1.16610]|uniref:Glycosyltransferase n=1 Tax=Paenibacillus anseongense TaxID=2682845 RepID=A0ABW9UND9_9BACL|nr:MULTISPECIES: glycosyltransferase [Paenibacillus]MBA2939760.1 glycosyltransferase [Paenibacillus sp. CGMCC 1.16610]MVQ39420.1 glycosyltransferase [Paenibacillus anseongense]